MEYQNVKKAYYDTPEGEVHYRYLHAAVKDASKAPILFLHMTAISGRIYEPLIQRCAAAGHDCFAPDMPGFGGSYDPVNQPAGIKYYVDAFMLLIKHANIANFHIVGHHTGASIGSEIALLYPDVVLSLTVSGPAIMTLEERSQWKDHDTICFNYPVADGTHLQKTWDFCWAFADWDPVELQPYVLDVARAYHGRIQGYTAVFDHDLIQVMGQLKGPILNLTAEDDMLSEYMGRVKEQAPQTVVEKVGGKNWEPLHDVDTFAKALLKFIGDL